MTPSEEAAIRAREQAATKGPWEVEPHSDTDERVEICHNRTVEASGIVRAHWIAECDSGLDSEMSDEEQEQSLADMNANAEFIAHARQDVPDLLAELDRLRAEHERLREGRFTAEEIQNICHNLQGTVSAREFADGCAAEQVKLYGIALDVSERHAAEARLRAAEARVQQLTEALREHGKHPATCPKGTGVGYYKPPADAVCNCGIDAALGEESASDGK